MAVRAHSAQSTLARRGRNLAERHARLSREPVLPRDNPYQVYPGRHTKVSSFRGLIIPQRPRAPSAEDCCMSRCEVCVHDLYVVSLRQYHQDLIKLQSALTRMQVPRQDWPSSIKSKDKLTDDDLINMKNEEQAAVAVAERASHSMHNDLKMKPLDAALEAGRLVLWVLRGCPG